MTMILPDSKDARDTDFLPAVGDQPPGDGKRKRDTERASAVSGSDSPTATPYTPPRVRTLSGPFLVSPLLVTLSRTMDEAENAWEAAAAHLRELQDPDLFGLASDDPAVLSYVPLVESAKAHHDAVEKQLEKAVAAHPLEPWRAGLAGVGRKQSARLLAAIGDPYWHGRDGRPRKISELVAYCGLDPDQNGVARQRHREEKINWNTDAKMRVYLIAKSCIRQIEQPAREYTITCGKAAGQVRRRAATPAGKYRVVYEQAREKYATVVHKAPCSPCGTRASEAIPLAHPLRLKSKYAKMMGGDLFTVDEHGTEKVFRDCSETEKQFIVDAGNERFFAQERIADRAAATMIAAPVGSPLKPGHQDAAAIHKVAAEFIKDLWRESKRLHETS